MYVCKCSAYIYVCMYVCKCSVYIYVCMYVSMYLCINLFQMFVHNFCTKICIYVFYVYILYNNKQYPMAFTAVLYLGCDRRVQLDHGRFRRGKAWSILCRRATEQVCQGRLRELPKTGSLECSANNHWMHVAQLIIDRLNLRNPPLNQKNR